MKSSTKFPSKSRDEVPPENLVKSLWKRHDFSPDHVKSVNILWFSWQINVCVYWVWCVCLFGGWYIDRGWHNDIRLCIAGYKLLSYIASLLSDLLHLIQLCMYHKSGVMSHDIFRLWKSRKIVRCLFITFSRHFNFIRSLLETNFQSHTREIYRQFD